MLGNLNKAKKVLKKDDIMRSLVCQFTLDKEFKHKDEPSFYFLCKSIISQQLSSVVTSVITQRFRALFEDTYPTPQQVLHIDDNVLKNIGFSQRKGEYIKNVAQFFVDNNTIVNNFNTLTDEQIIQHLIEIKGIGRWTIEMFLMFGLHREDVFSVGDLGLFTAVKILYNIKNCKNRKKQENSILRVTQNWKPYRTFASFYLWRWYENNKK